MKNTEFNKANLILRLFVSPLIFFILLITHILFVFKRFYHFLKYGGEYVNFEENEKPTLMEIHKMLKELNNKYESKD